MPVWWRVAAVVLVSAGLCRAQEPSAEQVRKMYDDALVQLKAAQDRKSELATENEKLRAQMVELEKQVQAMDGQLKDLRLQAQGWAERTYFLRSHYAAWQQFIQGNPSLLMRWRVFLEADLLGHPLDPTEFRDPDWPLSAEG